MKHNSSLQQRALDAHKRLRGKLSIVGKARLKSREDLNIYYTPGVGAVSSHLALTPDDARLYTMKGNTVAVVSDGSAVLGLGNIGPLAALPVMEGKALIFKERAGIDAFPIVLATQDTEEIIRTVCALAPGFGGINLEDISAPRCFEIESRLQDLLDIPVVHDDQRGTAIVVLAALINACRVVKKDLPKCRIVISGSGAAGSAIAEILLVYGVKDLILVDSKGIVSQQRNDLDNHKRGLALRTNPRKISGQLSDAFAQCDIAIGVSKAGLFTREYISSMADHPIVFAMANPIPEIMPNEAYAAGAEVVATGRSDFANQVNNALVFPGLFRGALDHRVRRITPAMMIAASRALCSLVARPSRERIIPSLFDRRVVRAVAGAMRL